MTDASTLRVVEIGSGVGAAYAAKLLGDHGADVAKVESAAPAGNEPLGTRLALNVNKRSVCLDDDRDLDRLLSWADVVVHGLSPRAATAFGVAADRLLAMRRDLVVLAITPFGHCGPYKDYAGSELIVANAGGWASLTPGSHADPALPPLKVFGHQCALMTGTAGAMAALAFAAEAKRSGVGEFIDLSEQAYTASVLEAGVPAYTYRGWVLKRFHPRGLIPWGTFQAKDGAVFIVCVEQDQWERLVEFMGRPDWATLEVFATNAGRAENRDIVHQLVQEFVAEWNAEELYHAAQRHRICVSPVMDYAQVAASEHLRARGFFETVEHDGVEAVRHMASPILTTGGRAPIRRSAPRPGQHSREVLDGARPRPCRAASEPRLPLSGVRVVDLTWVWAGTFGAMNLAHLGAEVIRFESAKRPDLYRRMGMPPADGRASLNRSGMFNQWNQGKKSVAVDLADPRGVAVVKAFVAKSDVVVQNFATGVMERLGLGYEALRETNPRIVLASISGYGQTGPHRQYMGYGPATSPLTGISAATGYVGGGPEEVGVSMPDPNAGITAAFAVVSALARREATGQGDHLDVSLVEASAAFGMEAWMQYAMTGEQPARAGNRDLGMAPHGCFPALGDDEWVAIACANDAHWQRLAALIDPPLAAAARFATLAARKENEAELETIVGDWTKDRDRWATTALLQSAGIAAFPAFSCRDIAEDPHLSARGYIERLPHPEVGARAHTGIPWRLSRRPNGVRSPAPCLGADTDELLRDLVGYDDARIAELRREDVLS